MMRCTSGWSGKGMSFRMIALFSLEKHSHE